MKIVNSKWYYINNQDSLIPIKIINEPLYGYIESICNEIKILNNVFKINLPIENIYYIYNWEKGIIGNTLVKYHGIKVTNTYNLKERVRFNHVNYMFSHYLYLKMMNKT